MIYEKKVKITSSMISSDGNLSKIGSFQIIQDAITELMGELKLDNFTVKEKYNAFWVFTKTRVNFIKKVTWNDEIVVSSFISLVSVAKINVDVEVKDNNGEILFYSRTEACALDFLNQRILKLSIMGVEKTLIESKDKMEITFTRFNAENLPIIDKVQIKYTNIDMSHHTNNLEYIRLILNTYSVEEMEAKIIKEIEIIYCSQSFEKDILNIRKASIENKDLIIIYKEEVPVVKCEIVY